MFVARCPWYVAGPLLGVLIIGLRLVVNKPLGALGGYIEVADQATGRRVMGFSGLLLIGTMLGGSLYALLSGTFALTAVYDTGIGFSRPAVPCSLEDWRWRAS